MRDEGLASVDVQSSKALSVFQDGATGIVRYHFGLVLVVFGHCSIFPVVSVATSIKRCGPSAC